ncbi:MAG: MarR family transcriptional regulator [Saprospiraceae bacterium]|nr:MarR family transcriptional regulator [Saprospiraceae bacterium]
MAVRAAKMDQVKQKVEQMGVFFEKIGHAPMSGRVFAYLLVSEPPYREFYDIQEFLAASKSSISNAINHLMNEGVVDYMTFSGDRKRYFRVNASNWLKKTKEGVRQVSVLSELVQEVLEDRSGSKHLDFNEGLKMIVDFQQHIAQGIEQSIASWEAKHGKA